MGNPKPQLLQKVISLCKKRGFVFPALPCKNATDESFAYGPLGAELKRNLINEWWHSVVTANENVHALSTPFQRLVSSAHVETETENANSTAAKLTVDPAPNGPILKHDLQQGALMHISDCIKCMSLKVPFGLAEVAKVVRSEPSSKYFILNSREYDCVGLQFFCSLDDHRQWYSHLQKSRLRWWKKFANHPEMFSLGEGDENSQTREKQANNDHNNYSTIQFEFPWGSHDLEIFTNFGDCFLQSFSTQLHGPSSSKDSPFKIAKVKGKKAFPFVISLSGNIDSALLAYLCDAYTETVRNKESKSTPVLRLHRSLAPYKVAVLPEASNNKKLFQYCCKLSSELRLAGLSTLFSVAGSTEERLQVQNEMGTPYRVLADEGMLESGVVRLQDRDTTIQEEVNGNDILPTLMKFLKREQS